jgi:hypothetical protein
MYLTTTCCQQWGFPFAQTLVQLPAGYAAKEPHVLYRIIQRASKDFPKR